MNPKEIVFLDEEPDNPSSPSSSYEEGEVVVDIDEEESDDNDEEEEEDNDDIDEFSLDDAANYFNRQNGDIRCRKCGNLGHYAVNCPFFDQSMEPCMQCASTQHQVKNCPTNICRQYLLLFAFILVATTRVTLRGNV